MSDANRTAIRVSKEASFKTLVANPIFQQLRITSASLAYSPETTQSNEIDSTRQVNDLPLVGFSSGGDVPAEYSIGNMDPLLEGIFFNDWQRSGEILNGQSWKYGWGSSAATRISSVAATTITVTAASFLFGTASNAATGTAVPVGALICLTGFNVADQILRASATTATTITVAGATADASPPATARIKVIGFEGASGDIVATTTGGNALTSTTLNFTQFGLQVGQWVFVGSGANGFNSIPSGGFARVSKIAANRLDLDVVPTGFSSDAGTGKSIRVYFTDSIRNGTTEYSYQVEEEFGLAVGTRYLYHRGQECATYVLSGETKQILTETITFLGSDAQAITSTRPSGAATLAPTPNSVLNSSTGVVQFMEGGAAVGSPNFVNSFSISLENNLRAQDAVGVLGAAGIGVGRVNVTGALSTYFGDPTLYNKVLDNSVTSIMMAFKDPATNGLAEIFDMPRVKFSSGAPEVTGIDTDIYVPLQFQALRDLAAGRDYTLMRCRFEYYA